MGRYPSGQRGQTVNLLAMPSEVRILLSPFYSIGFCGVDNVLVVDNVSNTNNKWRCLFGSYNKKSSLGLPKKRKKPVTFRESLFLLSSWRIVRPV